MSATFNPFLLEEEKPIQPPNHGEPIHLNIEWCDGHFALLFQLIINSLFVFNFHFFFFFISSSENPKPQSPDLVEGFIGQTSQRRPVPSPEPTHDLNSREIAGHKWNPSFNTHIASTLPMLGLKTPNNFMRVFFFSFSTRERNYQFLSLSQKIEILY